VRPPLSPAKWWRCLDNKSLAVSVHTECGNCGATLMGPYCSNCGQHVHESARSVSALFDDAWHIVTHVDSRFWQTLYILLFKPGKLTKEYFAERRARYLPPVRLYLVLSVLFFAFGLATPHKDTVPPSVSAPITMAPGSAAAQGVEAGKTSAKEKSRTTIFDIANCDDIKTSFTWLQNSLRQSCVRNKENKDYGASVQRAFIANIPKMMFLFVPLMALVMLILYWRPRRYYVEHLVFFLHVHAAVFLLLLLQTLVGWIDVWLGWSTFAGWIVAIIGFYGAWYVYRAMRVYYGQGRLLTFTKLCVVGLAYLIGLGLTVAATGLLSVIIA
jgi:Protein of unknown function (DUF3667)